MKLTHSLAVIVAALAFVAPAQAAGLVARPKCNSLKCISASQLKNLEHSKYVCRNGRRYAKRWNCAAVGWLAREYHETLAAMRPKVNTHYLGYRTGLIRIRWAYAPCESGGDPFNKHNPKYRGKWQFDQGTWDKFAPRGYHGVDPANVPEQIQDQAALAVTYDAWPNC